MNVPPFTRLLLGAAKSKVNAADVFEVVPTRRVVGNVVGVDVGVQIIHFNRPNLNMGADGNIQTAAELHGEAVVVAVSTLTAAAVVLDAFDQRAVAIGVKRAEQRLSEGLELAGVLLD